jgi:hypothetical protein
MRNSGFIVSDKPWEELLWIIIPFITGSYSLGVLDEDTPLKPHGNRWRLLGFKELKSEYPWCGSSNTNVCLKGEFSQTIYWNNKLDPD